MEPSLPLGPGAPIGPGGPFRPGVPLSPEGPVLPCEPCKCKEGGGGGGGECKLGRTAPSWAKGYALGKLTVGTPQPTRALEG